MIGARSGRDWWWLVRAALFICVTAAVVIAARRIDWSRALPLLATGRPSWLSLAVLANAGIICCWAAFWRTLRPESEVPITYGRTFEIVSASSSLMNTVPFGGGHASSVLLLIRHGKTTRRGALSIFALDQLGEGVTKVCLFLLVGFLVPLPTWMRAGIITATLAVSALFVALAVASRWTAELAILKSWRRSATALVCASSMKVLQALAIVAVQRAFGVEISAAGTLLVFAAIILGTLVSVAPGNVGTYEASAFFAYRYLGIGPEEAFSLAIMQHLCFMLPAIGMGYVVLSRRTLLRSAIASR